MPISGWRVLGWLLLYGTLVLLPLLIVLLVGPPPARGLLVEFGALLGLLGLGILAMQLVMSGRQRWFALGVGQDNLLQFHRQTGLFGWALVFVHPLFLVLGDAQYFEYLDPRIDARRAWSLILVLLAVSALVASSLWRLSFGLPYEWWRALHGGLALLVVATALGHALLVDHYSAGLLTKALLTLPVGLALLLVFETRLLRPLRMRRKPWIVDAVCEEPGDATRLVLKADGHAGLRFTPGQYAWLTLGPTPFSLQQHPFSMSSDPVQTDRVEFTMKHSGDFTGALPATRPGTRAWLEGPYGVFSMDPAAGRPAVFIAGGVGITPIISMLRHCESQGAQQPLWLIYASDNEPDMLFRDECRRLAACLPLTLTEVLSDPPADWTGERGYVDAEMLARCLPPDDGRTEYYLCGPKPMMDQLEPALRAWGVDRLRLRSERFNLV